MWPNQQSTLIKRIHARLNTNCIFRGRKCVIFPHENCHCSKIVKQKHHGPISNKSLIPCSALLESPNNRFFFFFLLMYIFEKTSNTLQKKTAPQIGHKLLILKITFLAPHCKSLLGQIYTRTQTEVTRTGEQFLRKKSDLKELMFNSP